MMLKVLAEEPAPSETCPVTWKRYVGLLHVMLERANVVGAIALARVPLGESWNESDAGSLEKSSVSEKPHEPGP